MEPGHGLRAANPWRRGPVSVHCHLCRGEGVRRVCTGSCQEDAHLPAPEAGPDNRAGGALLEQCHLDVLHCCIAWRKWPGQILRPAGSEFETCVACTDCMKLSLQALAQPQPAQSAGTGHGSRLSGPGQNQGSKQPAATVWAPKNMIVRGALQEIQNQL